jgi:HSP20 family protein
MAANEVTLQQKKELSGEQERTEVGKYYSPYTDIYETADAIVVTMDMPGVDRSAIEIRLDKDVLTIVGHIDSKKYEGLEPVYTEYNVGNFTRRFTVSTEIDSHGISAQAADGVLTVRLPKAKAAVLRRIEVS